MTEDRTGVPVEYHFTVLDGDCKPIEGAVVDVWQCDKDGEYSQGAASFLRAFQRADAQGKASFKAIFPGWYQGRITHLHGKLFLGNVERITTNYFFPKDVEMAVYSSSLYAARGQSRTSVAQDIELRGDMARFDTLTMTVTGDVQSGYVGSYVIKYG